MLFEGLVDGLKTTNIIKQRLPESQTSVKLKRSGSLMLLFELFD